MRGMIYKVSKWLLHRMSSCQFFVIMISKADRIYDDSLKSGCMRLDLCSECFSKPGWSFTLIKHVIKQASMYFYPSEWMTYSQSNFFPQFLTHQSRSEWVTINHPVHLDVWLLDQGQNKDHLLTLGQGWSFTSHVGACSGPRCAVRGSI